MTKSKTRETSNGKRETAVGSRFEVLVLYFYAPSLRFVKHSTFSI